MGMKNLHQDVFAEATRLTQRGELQAATALIQRALRGDSAPMPTNTEAQGGLVIDAEARFIDDAAPPAGAAPDAGAEQWLHGSFGLHGRQLAYRLYVPPQLSGASGMPAPRPLVLMLHGCTQDPDDFAAGTRMNALAREAGVLVLYPAQIQHANAQKCWNWFKAQHQQRGRGEPALLAGLTRQVMAEYAVDAARVYVAGLSAGGAMADILGRCYPELFAAVGVHSGLPAGAAADLPAALAAMRSGAPAARAGAAAVRPVIVFHGDADGTVHPANGRAVVDAARSAQPGTGAAQVVQGQTPDGQRYTQSVYRRADGRSAIEHWLLHGAGHAWSGGSAAGSYTAPRGVDASAEMLRFFLSHTQLPAS
jgi:poly(hydroxyalkanoate) depolymerase family esterase